MATVSLVMPSRSALNPFKLHCNVPSAEEAIVHIYLCVYAHERVFAIVEYERAKQDPCIYERMHIHK